MALSKITKWSCKVSLLNPALSLHCTASWPVLFYAFIWRELSVQIFLGEEMWAAFGLHSSLPSLVLPARKHLRVRARARTHTHTHTHTHTYTHAFIFILSP